jgi:AraC-like DNA-binding protein
MSLLESELDRPPHVAVVDLSGIEAMAPAAFDVIVDYVRRHGPALGRVVTRVALVPPANGFFRAVAAGFFQAVESPFQVSYVDGCAAALAELGCKDPAAAEEAIENARIAAGAAPALLRRLRLHLDAHLEGPTLGAAATSIGVSSRTLQRSLRALGTSFVDEVQDARLRAAEQRLLETDDPVGRIALDIGCASSQHLARLFQKRRGTTPTAFRAQRRGGLPQNQQ